MASKTVKQVLELPEFTRTVKKLKANQKVDLEIAVEKVIKDPLIGVQKSGNLARMRVYKFKMVNQLNLLGYQYEDFTLVLTLISVGPHENFYRDLKRRL